MHEYDEQYEDEQYDPDEYEDDTNFLLWQINRNLEKVNNKLAFIIFWLLLPVLICFIVLIIAINNLNIL